jgi:hypothetical protein
MRRHRLLTPDLSLDGERFAIKLYRHGKHTWALPPHNQYQSWQYVRALDWIRTSTVNLLKIAPPAVGLREHGLTFYDPHRGSPVLRLEDVRIPRRAWMARQLKHASPIATQAVAKTTLKVNEPLRRGGCQSLTRTTIPCHFMVATHFPEFL